MGRAILCCLLLGATTSVRAAIGPELLASHHGNHAGDRLGLFVCDAGDLDGDGTADFAIGAPGGRGNGLSAGEVWVYLDGTDLDGDPGLLLGGEADGDQFGTSVRGCGDVNGDGWDDLVVGAPRNDAAFDNAGRAYVYFGGPSLDDQADLVIDGPAASAFFGYSVAGAGDLDGNGGGLIVGSPAGTSADGRAFIYLGGAGLDATADLTLAVPAGGYFGWAVNTAGDFTGDGWDDVIVGGNTLANVYLFAGGPGLDDQPDLVFSGDAGSNRFGYGLAPAGDVNGDGWDDVIIGDMHNGAGGLYAGRAHVFFGGPGADGQAELVYTGTTEYGIFGRTVAGAGDLDGDGLDDLIVGAPTPDTAGHGPGQTFVFLGGDTLGTNRADTLADYVFTGAAESDRLGAQVAIVGDQNGDGRPDFLVGADLADSVVGASSGVFYLYGLVDSLVVPEEPLPLPRRFVLAQNTPNPFNPSTTIAFDLLEDSPILLQVLDLQGRLVRELASVYLYAGPQSFVWDGRDRRRREMPSGVYLYRLATPVREETRAMTLLR
ncbi:MAG: hypothetical protein R3D98_05610 [Candidatus Krumholzibacteriia bacterium]